MARGGGAQVQPQITQNKRGVLAVMARIGLTALNSSKRTNSNRINIAIGVVVNALVVTIALVVFPMIVTNVQVFVVATGGGVSGKAKEDRVVNDDFRNRQTTKHVNGAPAWIQPTKYRNTRHAFACTCCRVKPEGTHWQIGVVHESSVPTPS